MIDPTYVISAIVPTLNSEGLLTQVAFQLDASDEFGNHFQMLISGLGGFPAPAGDSYTDEELQGICQTVGEGRGAYTHLAALISSAQTPRYVPPPPPPTMSDDQKKDLWMTQIDNNVAAVYNQFTRFQMEYEQREKAAQAYKDAGYTGDPTVWVTAFADSNGISYQMCADLILSQANSLRAAVVTLGEYRMNKYKVKNAATIEEADTEFNKIISDVAALARSL